ncbi:hypothetical protein C8Q76DRAFT_362939 [Earliella scabrosa]|nr:hypothetical protein C8Q76DRAFT_362939 [Earliella scabrosa]
MIHVSTVLCPPFVPSPSTLSFRSTLASNLTHSTPTPGSTTPLHRNLQRRSAFALSSSLKPGTSCSQTATRRARSTAIPTHDAIDRMGAAGVQVLSMFSVAGELMRDWRNTPGAPGMLPFFDKYMPEYAVHACAHDAAVENGALSDL